MSSSGINRRNIKKFTEGLQKEFDKYPMRIPVEADGPSFGSNNVFISNNNVGHAQVVTGDNYGVIAKDAVVRVASGYEELAQNIQRFTDALRTANALGADDSEVLDEAESEALNELAKPEPDRKLLRKALSALRGLASVIATGVGSGATEEIAALGAQLALPG